MQQPRGRVTIRDVAEQASVSAATVSKVVNRRYGVAAGTAARVRAVISELGYEAGPAAQGPGRHRTNVIGVLVADVEPYSTELLKGAADAVRGSGFGLVVCSAGGRCGDTVGWERRCLSQLGGTLVDGAVLVTPTVVDVQYGSPVVAVDPHTGSSGFPTVDADNLRGARLATEHLLGLGHRRIALLAGRADLQSARLREQGYREALAAAGAPGVDPLVRIGGYDADLSRLAAHELLTGPRRPSAVFAANDITAIATMEVALGLGLRVPEDLSVVGFDNIPESALCSPPLTTVNQPIRTMGEHAVEMLMRLILGRPMEPTHLTLVTELVVRGSTAPPQRAP